MTRDGPLWLVILAVGTGAGLGAVCRWMLSYFLNPLSGWMPWGTLASNAAGGLLIGAARARIPSCRPPYGFSSSRAFSEV